MLRLLLGRAFESGASSLAVLMAAYVAICWGYVSGSLVIVLNLQKRYIIYALVTLVVNVGLNLVLVPKYGYAAAAWVTLLSEVVVVGLTMHLVLKTLEYRPRLGRLVLAVVASAALTGVLLAGREIGAGVLVLAVVVYPLLLGVLRAVSVAEIRRLFVERKS